MLVSCGSGKAEALHYPDEIMTLEAKGITEEEFVKRAAGETSYVGNGHTDGTEIVISPVYSASSGKTEVPVYAVPVYVASENKGTLHSYASVMSEGEISLELTPQRELPLEKAYLVSEHQAELKVQKDGLVLSAKTPGSYTVVFGDSQVNAFTLFLREWTDEEAEIASYKAAYGEDHVIVYEKGLHEIDHLSLEEDNTVLYLKAGAILLPKHTFDVTDDAANASLTEEGAKEHNAIGLSRYPVINGYGAKNLMIAGQGTVDMSEMDWHERRGVVFTLCENVTVENLILLNPAEWAFISYRNQNVTVKECAVLGYRTNSDAFAICNTQNAEITDSFARSGDDLFEVKTLGGPEDAVSENITFRYCTAWGSKARCFGIPGEIERDIRNVTFSDSTVITRDAVWDNDRLGSLVIIRETGAGTIKDVTFENIRVLRDDGRVINVNEYVEGLSPTEIAVTFRNIVASSVEKPQFWVKNAESKLEVTLDGVSLNGETITENNKSTLTELLGSVSVNCGE